MTISPEGLKKINAYLEAVGAHLSGSDRQETLAGIESHIHEAIAARERLGQGEGAVDAVLAEMDSPRRYAQESPGESTGGEPQISRFAVAGLFFVPWGFLAFWYGVRHTPIGERWSPSPFFESGLFVYLLLPLSILSPIIANVLGHAALEQIRQSRGRVIGGALAAIDTAIAPLLFVNMLLVVVISNIMSVMGKPTTLVVLLAVILANVWMLRRIIAKSS